MGEKKELRQVARQLGRGELEEEFVRLTVERNGLKRANNALKDVVVRLNGEIAQLRRPAPSAREFDIWNR